MAALVGYEEFRKWARTTDISKKGMLDTSLTDFDALTEPDYIDGSTTEFSSRSVFGRVTYTYDSRYLFEANVRYDGSSRFLRRTAGVYSHPFRQGGVCRKRNS